MTLKSASFDQGDFFVTSSAFRVNHDLPSFEIDKSSIFF